MTGDDHQGGRPAWPTFDTLALIWLGLAAAWLIVLIISDLPVWPLAVWLALTFGQGRRPCRPHPLSP